MMNVMRLRSVASQPCSHHRAIIWSALTVSAPPLPTQEASHLKRGLLSVGGLKGGTLHYLQTRTLYTRLLKKYKSLQRILENDNVGSHYELVYKTDMKIYLQLGLGGVQSLAAFMAAAICAMALGVQPPNIGLIAIYPFQATIFAAVNTLICIGILRVIASHPIRIYYSEKEDQFIAVFLGKHPFDVSLLSLRPGEVKPVVHNKVVEMAVPWHINIFTTHTHKIYLNEIHFKYPIYYNKLLGYGAT